MRQLLRLFIGFVLVAWASAQWLRGYIDPNTGGMLFQLLAILFAFTSAIILFFSRQIRMGVARISRLLRGLFSH